MNEANGKVSGLTIGALSQATGIAVETLRTWERRYGLSNHVERDPGGQRRYLEAEVARLRLVKQALQNGHRAASVVNLNISQLSELLELVLTPASGDVPVGAQGWLVHVKTWDWLRLSALLNQAASQQSSVEFLDSRLGPFLTQLGDAWANNEVDVAQEHLASECILEFLTRRWMALNALNTGPVVVLTTLPTERHVLGLHMAAWTLAICGARLVFLGADTPLADISHAVRRVSAQILILSASAALSARVAREQLEVVLEAVPRTVNIAVGGKGFSGLSLAQASSMDSFAELQRWFTLNHPSQS